MLLKQILQKFPFEIKDNEFIPRFFTLLSWPLRVAIGSHVLLAQT